MSLPLGHLALGATIYDATSDQESIFRNWRPALLVTIMANLPDLDMVFGLLLEGNAKAFHRGPSHSLLFAALAALLVANGRRILPRL